MNLRKTFVETPLAKDVLLLRAMEGHDYLGRPFEYELDLLANSAVKPAELLAKPVTVHLALAGGGTRYFHGHVAEFTTLGVHGQHLRYRAKLRPWLWFLTRAANCRIFQRLSVPEIVKKVCTQHGFTDVEQALSGSYEPCEYRVQYRESDFAFVSRLLEQEGIYYYFKHAQNKHTLVLADGPAAHLPEPGYETISYSPHTEDAGQFSDRIDQWQTAQQVQPGAYSLDDYDFERPAAELKVRLNGPTAHAGGKFEIYDYPGGYVESAAGERYARLRMEELHARFEHVSVSGTVRALGPGVTFALAKYPRAEANRRYLVVEAHHRFELDEYGASAGASREDFRCDLSLLDATTPFRPARTTPRPSVTGLQSATVVGRKGEEIWTDKHGRVKVQFPWDREGRSDENSSCWIRVAQLWAGSGFGTLHVPRIGQEVLVSFLDGDPDRPLVTGSVYNGSTPPPFPLPGSATVSGTKTDSTKDAVGYNELSFDDAKGAERIVLHAQQDMESIIKRDSTGTVGRHLSLRAEQNVTVTAGKTLVLSAGDELRLKVGAAEIVLLKSGKIEISGVAVTVDAQGKIVLRGLAIAQN